MKNWLKKNQILLGIALTAHFVTFTSASAQATMTLVCDYSMSSKLASSYTKRFTQELTDDANTTEDLIVGTFGRAKPHVTALHGAILIRLKEGRSTYSTSIDDGTISHQAFLEKETAMATYQVACLIETRP